MFFIDKQATVIGYTDTAVTVGKGTTKSWAVKDKFTSLPGTMCVLRGVTAG